MIVVFGATGTVGGRVVRLLSRQGAAVRAVTRDPATAQFPDGVTVAGADLADRDSLDAALRDATALLLVAPSGPDQPTRDAALVAAARRAGVPRLVKLSAIGTGLADHPEMGAWHAPGEQAVRDSGAAWTILRPTTFASNMLFWAEAIRAGQPVPDPFGDGAQGVVDPDDIAAVAVAALSSTVHDGQTYTLTGPQLLTLAEQVAILADIAGRPASTAPLGVEEWRGQLLASGADPAFADTVTAGVRFVRAGHNAVLTDDVARVTGREPGTFSYWAARHRTAFA